MPSVPAQELLCLQAAHLSCSHRHSTLPPQIAVNDLVAGQSQQLPGIPRISDKHMEVGAGVRTSFSEGVRLACCLALHGLGNAARALVKRPQAVLCRLHATMPCCATHLQAIKYVAQLAADPELHLEWGKRCRGAGCAC